MIDITPEVKKELGNIFALLSQSLDITKDSVRQPCKKLQCCR